MRGIEAVIGEILAERERSGARPGDYLEQIWEPWADAPAGERAVQVARDVMIIHMGAQSNLYAALAWTLVNVLLRPDLLARIEAGDDALLERCANESIRMAQNSLTLRQVLRPIEVHDGVRTYRLAPGTFLATMLSLNNTQRRAGARRVRPRSLRGPAPVRGAFRSPRASS